jgi:hypothetical protein
MPLPILRRLLGFAVFACLFSSAFGEIKPLSLEGTWRLRLDAKNEGLAANWAGTSLPVAAAAEIGSIRLPGTTDLAGAGEPNPKAPSFLGLQRPIVFTGAAWYEREINIPNTWRGKRVVLFLERAHWETRAWIDGRELGSRDSLVTPHEYEIGVDLAPGKHRLTVRVDNTVKFDLGRFASINYEFTQTNWNGLIGRLELRATEPTWIDDLQVYPRVATRSVLVKGRVGGFEKLKANARVKLAAAWLKDKKISGKIVQAPIAADGSFEAEYALNKNAPLWDEFDPALHQMTATLANDETRTVRFGLREVGVRGTRFTLNDRIIFLRGTCDNATFPMTGHPPTDAAWWMKTFETVRRYGLNHFRYHSWTPPEAAFEAADALGLLLQVEGPQANVTTGQVPERDAFIAEETRRILRAYGNHPSFVLYTPGNELRGDPAPLLALVDEGIKADRRHLYSSSTYGFGRGAFTENRQFTILSRARGVRAEGTEDDHRRVVASYPHPLISHEIGQWAMYPNLAEAAKYTGLLKADNYELVRESLRARGLLDMAPRFFDATGRHSVLMYKEELEAVLRTPGSAGFQQLALEDYPGQGMALVGVLDGFFDSKGLITPEAYRRFCDVTVALARLPKRTFFSDETLRAAVDIAHFGATDLPAAELRWRLRDTKGVEIAAGTLSAKPAASGGLTEFGKLEVKFGAVVGATKLNLGVALAGTTVENDWDLWVYPREELSAARSDADAPLVTRTWDDAARAALAAGKTVLLQPFGHLAQARRGSFRPVFWSPVWFNSEPATMGILCDPQHPALAQFPTEYHSNWQWWDPLSRSLTFILNELPAGLEPIVRVIDNFSRNDRLGNIFEARVGPGRLLVCGINLTENLEERPAAQQLRRSLLAYLASPAFQPKTELTPEALDRLFAPAVEPFMRKLGARVVRASSEDGARVGRNVIDGNPRSIWQTPWRENAPKFPHELVVEFPNLVVVRGLKITPTQDANGEGRIKDFALYTSRDRQESGDGPTVSGSFPAGTQPHVVMFNEPTELRMFRFVALSGFNPENPGAALAEIELIVD